MALAPGTRLGPFEVLAKLGEGGMGEVYKARDTKLARDVALKTVLAAVAADPDRLARFSREARVLASLNHPNIAQIYGLEEAGGVRVLVLELVEGPTLAERLARGRLPLDEALTVARQIAEALEAAHEHGVIHRDLKPANIKLRDDGTVKVLDFGLAKAVASSPGSTDPGLHHDSAESPTMTSPALMTGIGMIIGTAAYMAPEQARGKAVDRRADVWAFGVVLFEMLAGRPCFAGETTTDILAAIVKTEPDWAALPPETPPRVRTLLARCLAKDPRQRLHDMADARIELGEPGASAAESGVIAAPASSAAPRWRVVVPWVIAALAVATAAWALLGGRESAVAPRDLVLAVPAPAGTVSSGPIDISADGQKVAFTAAGPDAESRLYVRSLDALDPKEVAGTDDASSPFFSPDGRSVGFFAHGKLKRVDLAGGPPRELADAPDPRGGSWGSQNVIVFAPVGGSPIFQVPASGGNATPVTALDPTAQEVSHRWPHFLPDGKAFVFLARKPRPPARLAVEVASLDGGRRTRLVESTTSGIYSGGRLYFVRQTTLLAQAFDLDALALSGEPEPAAEDVWQDLDTDGRAAFAVAGDGTLAWRGGGFKQHQLTWFDREGHPVGSVGQPSFLVASIDLSRDERRVAAIVADPAHDNLSMVYVLDNSPVGTVARANVGEGNQLSAVFSPDARSVVFASDLKGSFDLYRSELGRAGDATPLVVNSAWKIPESWSSDSRFVSYSQREPGKPADIWILPMAGDRKPFPFAQTAAAESGSSFSPDGRFLAYTSDESGTIEVFVQTFPASGAKWQVSSGGGASPVWRRDGKELFYLTPDRRLIAVPITAAGGSLQPGAGRVLFKNAALRMPTPTLPTTFRVSADGLRFLMGAAVGEDRSSPITIRTRRAR